MKQIVIMPGGFHPFHAGHYSLYQSALKAFPNAEVYVAATNDQSERPFPFSLKEKLAKLAGVEPGHFIQVKSPFQAKEITQNYNPEEDVLIFVRSEKDRNEQPKPGGTKKDGTPAYFQPWTGKDVQPFAKHAYFAYLPTVEFGPGITSATQIRKAWPTLNDKRKLALVMSLYPAAQKNVKLAQTVVRMFDQVMGGQLNEFAPGNGDDGLPYAEYVVYQCDPKDQFEFIGRPLYQTDSLGMAHKYAYEMFLKHRPKAFVVYQPHKEASRGNYGVKGESDEQGVAEGANVTSQIKRIKDRILQLKDWNTAGTHDKKIKELQAKLKELQQQKQGVAEGSDIPHWRVEQSDATGRYYVVTGYTDKTRKVWKSKLGAIDFVKKADAEAKAQELNRGVAEGMVIGCCPNEDANSTLEMDPELERVLLKAKQHYPNQPDRQHAFMKYVQRALRHSEEDDARQDNKLQALDQEVDQLQRKLNVSESVDYLDEK